MGKSAKIRKLNAICKKMGLGRFYKGKGRLVKRDLSNGYLDYLIMLFSIPAGAVVHDCDGFNHVVKGLAGASKWEVGIPGKIPRRPTWYWYDDQLEFSDIKGQLSCGCPMGIQQAKSREDIEKWYRDYLDYQVPRDPDRKGFITDQDILMHQTLKEGRHICDERGIILDEFRRH
jgi:hypothetical protein